MKFSIRDLLFVTVIVALVLGWLAERTRLLSELRTLQVQQELFNDRVRMQMSFGFGR
jgi:hypothetical protein